MSYWLIKTLLLIGLLVVAYFMLRPVRSAGHLAMRRLGVMLIVAVAVFAVVFPEIVNTVAQAIGVYSGVNLLVYILILAVFTQMATSYRRDVSNERKLTLLARAIALEGAPKPDLASSTSQDLSVDDQEQADPGSPTEN